MANLAPLHPQCGRATELANTTSENGGHKQLEENKTQPRMEAQALFKQCTRPNLKYISP